MNEKERLALKEEGFFAVRGSDRLSVRFSSGGGSFSADQLIEMGQLAREFGNGKLVISSRLSAEIVGIRKEDIGEIKKRADQAGLERGLSGPRIRTVTSCMGTYCVKGTYDTLDLLPNRFKICVGGCPNSCMKPSLNDFGIEGHIVPEYDENKCRGCKVCQIKRHCPSDAISFIDGKVHVMPDKCKTCGICRNKCPFHVFHEDARTKYQIYLGGTWGRNSRIADRYPRLVERAEIFPLLDRTLAWYKRNAAGHERFGMTLERLGFQTYLREVSPDDGGISCIFNMTRHRPTI